ncbi:hypothetical protein QA640_14100 [Bradyrhizobium sp. CB82]|uniref:hypothetical protein n=1 Tax=Bradyrhizobium sp. CB82 TaxID=3039159 RepID=UPI0024B21E0F|nr:hypothetical protein [Bradyrhizobium sp. CB82]WFU43476.1 hypothetical protein QA640_14100 [Bradyrhizobium sp. CB82]
MLKYMLQAAANDSISDGDGPIPSELIDALVSGLPAAEQEAHRLMVLQTGYFDDSGSHAASEYYVLAGFVAPVSDWKFVADEWARILNEEGLAYFKMREAMAMEGEFKRGWTVPLRDQLILKLVGLIEKIDPPKGLRHLYCRDIAGCCVQQPLFYPLLSSCAVGRDCR